MPGADDESQSRFQSGRVSLGYSQLLVRVMVQVSWACNVMCTPVPTSDQVGHAECVSKWQGESRVLTVVGENHGASKLGLQCHVYTSVNV